MVDQYCGFNAKAGGGVFVLEQPWSGQPVARELLGDSKVGNGRLRGRRLEGGAFNTLELDHDAGTLTGLQAKPRIVMVDGHAVDVPPADHMLVVRNDDRPGVIGVVYRTAS